MFIFIMISYIESVLWCMFFRLKKSFYEGCVVYMYNVLVREYLLEYVIFIGNI